MGTVQPSESSSSSPDDFSSDRVEGKRFGRLIRLNPEYRNRYIALHAHPFPEVLEQIRASNLRNYSIFLKENLLFSFFEYVGSDYDADMEAMAENPTVQDWWTLTDPMQESLSPEDSEEWWTTMEELFHGGLKTQSSCETEKKAFVTRLREGTANDVKDAYAEMAPGLDDALATADVQNYAVYRWQNRLYTYLECTGASSRLDVEQLANSTAMQALFERVTPLIQTASGARKEFQRPMESVFYTP